jgi:RNA polymerase sigma-70 factor, ECF subfamily
MVARVLTAILMERILRVFREDITERELARRLQNGDTQAMADLYERYRGTVYAIALRMVRNASTAEDLVQETFIRIWNGIGLFDVEKGTLGTWIGAVTRNRVLDYLRSADCRMTRTNCALERVDRCVALPVSDPLSRSALARAVTSLAVNHRRVLELAYLEGLSQTEIARRINRPLGTVKTWARAALKCLREQITQADALPG